MQTSKLANMKVRKQASRRTCKQTQKQYVYEVSLEHGNLKETLRLATRVCLSTQTCKHAVSKEANKHTESRKTLVTQVCEHAVMRRSKHANKQAHLQANTEEILRKVVELPFENGS